MIVLWWLVSVALVVLSTLLLFAGILGKEGVLRIGLPSEPQRADASGQPSGQAGEAPAEAALAEAAPAQPGEADNQATSTLPIEQSAQGPEGSAAREPEIRRMNIANVAIGAAGVVVGLAALIIFAI